MKNETSKIQSHTPGPWTTDGRWIVQLVDGRSFWPGQSFIADCSVSVSYREKGETEANAQLIATAPELLEAIKAVMQCNHVLGAISRPVADQARAAISKAEGKV